MSIRSSVLPPLPWDTARAAEAAFGRGNFYLTIGDQFEQLLSDIDFASLGPDGQQSPSTLADLALVTIFQFLEDLPDRRAAEAIRTRTDWKYALHLPLAYPGLEHSVLCRFRQRILNDRSAREAFQHVFNRLLQTGLLRDADVQRSEGNEVLPTVCAISRLERLVEDMHAVLEALAAIEPRWLLTNTLPHWYERYNQIFATHVLPKSNDEQVTLVQAIGKDALFLLDAIATSSGELAQLPEVETLRQEWHQQFSQKSPEIDWRSPVCVSCTRFVRPSNALPLRL
jgi:transposase